MENNFWKCIGALYAAEQELVFKCNKKVGVIFPPEKFKQSVTPIDFLNGSISVKTEFVDQVKYIGVLLHALLMDDI